MVDFELEKNLLTNIKVTTTAQTVNIAFDPPCCRKASTHVEIAILRPTLFRTATTLFNIHSRWGKYQRRNTDGI